MDWWKVESYLQTFASNVSTCIGPSYFFFGLERTSIVTGLRKQGRRELKERLR